MKTKLKLTHRYLVKTYPFWYNSEIYEIAVLEISKKHVKIRYITDSADGTIEWKKFEDIEIIEDLGIYTYPSSSSISFSDNSLSAYGYMPMSIL